MEDLTTGSISRHLLKTTSFMLVTMVFQTLYFLVDLYWVGRLGKEAIAGVGIAGNLTFIVLAITQMLAVGTTTLISHAAGRKEREQAQLVLTQSLLLSVLHRRLVSDHRHGAARAVREVAESGSVERGSRERVICPGSFLRWRCSFRWW